MTQPGSLSALVSGLLDRGYEQATAATLHAVASSVQSGRIAQRLAELDAESTRLAAVGQRLQPDNPVLRALTADLDTALRQAGRGVDAGAAAAQSAGVQAAGQVVRALALPGVSDEALRTVGVGWNVPDPEAVNALIGYVNSDGWAEAIARYPDLVLETVQHQALLGMIEGWGAERTAREIRRMAQGVPLAQANNLLRTVQLQSFRDASALHQLANADILTEQIRIAALDDRCCLACIALHGTRLPLGERIVDHHQGRCLVPGQKVTTARGDVPVEQVRVGDWVLTHRGRYRRVVNTFSRWYAGEVIEVGHRVTVTPEHPILTPSGWVEARRLSASDTFFTLDESRRRVSSRRISHPIGASRASRRAARSLRDFTFSSAALPHTDDTMIHRPGYTGYVFDLEVEEDHSFFAEGVAVHNCMAIPVVRGRPRSVTTGADWFAGLDEERRRSIAGDAAFEALASGRADLRDFVQPYQDRVFGEMVREASVKGVLGSS